VPVLTATAAAPEVPWPLEMAMGAPNLLLWLRCRDVVQRFGEGYKRRTDTNGAMMISYIALVAFVLLFQRALWGDTDPPLSIRAPAIAFFVIVHVVFVVFLGVFAVAIALEGERHYAISDQSKSCLAAAMMAAEAARGASAAGAGGDGAAGERAAASTRCAAQQLHEALTADRLLNNASLMYLIDLDKALVASAVVACVTQLTLVFEKVSVS
jgi:hypothetical protein